jgi:basic membrane protein A
VIFHAAAGTGLGVLQAAKDRNKLAIGVDSNQNHLFPGRVLTSVVKRVDNVVYQVMMDAKQGKWQPGVVSMGLKEGGMDWTLDQHNRALITPAMEKQINQAKQAIIAGKVKVSDYRVANSCPVK